MSRLSNSEGAIPDDIFKMYDIRGVAHQSLTSETMRRVGQAFGTVSLIKSIKEIVVGCDARTSSPEFKASLIEGIRSTGCNVIDLGTIPTPIMYFATHHLGSRTGLMVTASHNPPQYNGVKMVLDGHSIYGSNIQKLKERIHDERFLIGNGNLKDKLINDEYSDAIISDIRLERPIRAVVDCANGIAGAFLPAILRRIGCEVHELYCEVDGTFPNHEADPTKVENLTDLIRTVQEVEADVGLGIDGDGDRMVVVSPSGSIIWPDRLMILFARQILSRQPGRSVVFDVKCTRALPIEIEKAGGKPVMWMTGHSLMKSKMIDCDGVLGGEMSGHMFFRDRWPGFDDGLYASARLCELLASDVCSPAEVFDTLPLMVSTPEIRVDCPGPHKLVETFGTNVKFPDATISHLDGVRADFADGFGLLRASNTASELVFRFEADTQSGLSRIQNRFREEMAPLQLNIQLPF